MAEKIIPEDGCFRALPSSNSNAINNIMIVKVSNLKSSGESTYQLATLDRSIKGMVWPADTYVSKLFPGLPEIQISEDEKACESKKILNLSLNAVRPEHKCPFIETFSFRKKRNFKKASFKKKKLSRKKNRFNRSKTCDEFQSKLKSDEIQPWLQNPLDNELCMLPDGSVNLNIFPTSYKHFYFSHNYFYDTFNDGLYAPPDLNSISCMLGVPPPSSGYLQNFYPEYHKYSFPNYDIANCRYDLKTGPNPCQYHNISFSRNASNRSSRIGQNLGQNYKNDYSRNARSSKRGSRHGSFPVKPCNNYIKAEIDTSENFMYDQGCSAHYYVRDIPYISPITWHENYIPTSRYEPIISFENEYVEPEVYGSVACNEKMWKPSCHIQYSCAQNKSRRKKYKRSKRRQKNSCLKPGENVNSFRRNNSLKLRQDINTVRSVYNENQRKHWIVNKNSNFK